MTFDKWLGRLPKSLSSNELQRAFRPKEEKMSAIKDKVIEDVFAEIRRAEKKHPGYPIDPIHAAAILAEENGEVQKACLQWTYEGGNINEVRKEAVHTAAMALRFLFNLEYMEPRKSE